MSDRITHSDKPVHSSKQLHGAVNDQERLHSVQKQNGQKAEQTNKLVNAQVIPAIEIEGHDKASKKSAHAENKSAANHKAVQSAEHKGNGVQLMETISSGFQNVWNAGDRLIHTVEKRIGQQVDSAEKNLSNGMKAAGIPEPVKNAVSFGVHCTRMQIEDNYKMNKGLSKGVTRFVGETAGTLLHLEAEIVDELKSKETAEKVMEKFSNPAAMAKRLSTGVPYVPFIEEAVEHVAQNHLNEVTGAVGKLTDHYSKNGGWNKAFDDAGKATQNYLTHFAQADKEEQFEVIGKDVVPLILDGIAAVKVVSEVNAFVKGARGVKVAATVAEGEAVAEGAICKATGEASDLGGFAKGEAPSAKGLSSACESADSTIAKEIGQSEKIPGRRPYQGPMSIDDLNKAKTELADVINTEAKPIAKAAEKILQDKIALLEDASKPAMKKIEALGLKDSFREAAEKRFVQEYGKEVLGPKPKLDDLKKHLGDRYESTLDEFIKKNGMDEAFIRKQIKSEKSDLENIAGIIEGHPGNTDKIVKRLDLLMTRFGEQLNAKAHTVLETAKSKLLQLETSIDSVAAFASHIRADEAYEIQDTLSNLMRGCPDPKKLIAALKNDDLLTAVTEICRRAGRFPELTLEKAKFALLEELELFVAGTKRALSGRAKFSDDLPLEFKDGKVYSHEIPIGHEIPRNLIQGKAELALKEIFGKDELPSDVAKFVESITDASACKVVKAGDKVMVITAQPSI